MGRVARAGRPQDAALGLRVGDKHTGFVLPQAGADTGAHGLFSGERSRSGSGNSGTIGSEPSKHNWLRSMRALAC